MLVSWLENLFLHAWNGARRSAQIRRGRTKTKSTNDHSSPIRQYDIPVPLGEVRRSRLDERRRPGQPAETITLTAAQRRKHLYLLGSTGSGKTNTVLTLLDHDIDHGRGICLVDYRGDLYDRVLARLAAHYDPAELADRLFLLDFRDRASSTTEQGAEKQEEYIVGFDPLAMAGDSFGVAFFLLDVLRQQWGEDGLGVRVEEGLRNSLLCIAMTGGSLLQIEPLLTDSVARREMLARVTDIQVLRFFDRFDALSVSQREQWVSPILNKLTAWLARPNLREILANRETISFRTLLEKRPDAIVLVSLGADTLFQLANIMGCLVVNAIASALIRPERREARDAVFLYLDEFENFTSLSERFASILAEGRKFGIGLTLSHQSSSQLDPKLRILIRDIVNTQMFFATGATDTDRLADEITGQDPKPITKQRLMNQKVGEACLVRKGLPPVYIATKHTPDADVLEEKVEALRDAALRNFGRPRSEIDSDLGISRLSALVTAKETPTTAIDVLSDQPRPDSSSSSQIHPTLEVRDLEPEKPKRRPRYQTTKK